MIAREMTSADEVFASAKRLKSVFFPSRQVAPTQVISAPEKAAAEPTLAPETRQECEMFPLLGDAPPSAEVERDIIDLTALVIEPNPAFAPRVRAKQIVQKIACDHGVTAEDVLGTSRTAKTVKARHAAIAEIYTTFPQWSLEKVAQFFGVHHTSVLHAIRKMGVWRGAAA